MSVSSPNKTVSDGLDTAIGRRHLGGFLETPAATGDEAWTREEQSPVLIRQLKLPKRDAQDQKWEDQQHVAVPAGFWIICSRSPCAGEPPCLDESKRVRGVLRECQQAWGSTPIPSKTFVALQ